MAARAAKRSRRHAKADNPSSSAVYKLHTLIETDPMIRMYVTQMIDQVPDAHKVVTNVTDMLAQLNMVVVTVQCRPQPAPRVPHVRGLRLHDDKSWGGRLSELRLQRGHPGHVG